MNFRFATMPLVLLLTLTTTALFAQSGRGGGNGGGGGGGGGGMGPSMGDPKEYLEERMAELEEQLSLSGAQAVAIQALHQDFFTQLESARSSGGDRRAMMETMKELRDQTDEEVVKLLTDEQAVKYREIRAEEMKEMESRMRERRGRGGKH